MRLVGAAVIVAVALSGAWLLWSETAGRSGPREAPFPLAELLSGNDSGFADVEGAWDLRLPDDYGAHPSFRSELWNFNGELADQGGVRFGFGLTIVRLAFAPGRPQRASAWAANQVYLALLTISDGASGEFHVADRQARAALGLSGATQDPVRVWAEDWSMEVDPTSRALRLQAEDGDLSIRLVLKPEKRALGDSDADPLRLGGRAFHFYLVPRLTAAGSLLLGGTTRTVKGTARFDRAWGAVPVGQGPIALNRFGLALGDGRDLICLELRRRDGSGTPVPSCLLVGADGSVRRIGRREIRLEPLHDWRSPLDGVAYPVVWRLAVAAEGLDLEIRPLIEDQEVNRFVRLWRGAVTVSGTAKGKDVTGHGSMELSGYANDAPPS